MSIINWSNIKPVECVLDGNTVKFINSSLRAEKDVTKSCVLKANKQYSFVGVQPNSKNFYLTPEQAQEWIDQDKIYQDVLRPFKTADDLTDNPKGVSSRWIIDFSDRSLEELDEYPNALEQAVRLVKPERQNNRERVLREKWWRFKRTNSDLRGAMNKLDQYICFPRHSKWVIPLFIERRSLPGDSTTVVAIQDLYILGVLTSIVHRVWIFAQKSTLKGDTRYTHTTCFNTFPFPQIVSTEITNSIRQAMAEINDYRNTWMADKQLGVTKLYNLYYEEPASKLYKLHHELDAAVLKAYGWSADEDLLSNLFDMNLELAEREDESLAIVGPWDPSNKDEAH